MGTLVAPKAQEGQLSPTSLSLRFARLAIELQSCCVFIRLAVSLIHAQYEHLMCTVLRVKPDPLRYNTLINSTRRLDPPGVNEDMYNNATVSHQSPARYMRMVPSELDLQSTCAPFPTLSPHKSTTSPTIQLNDVAAETQVYLAPLTRQ
jgi:hypothetical protein